jgi:hypothetical protein
MMKAGKRAALLAALAWCGLTAGAGAQCGVNWSGQFDATFFPNGAGAMLAHDDGSGPALYIGSNSGFVAAHLPLSIVRYRGPRLPLETVGGGISGVISALAAYDDGGGAKLYAAGSFTSAGGVACNSIARWNGTAWSPLGSGLDGPGLALAVYDDGTGPALFVGGQFSNAGGVAAQNLAKWNGSTWSGVTAFSVNAHVGSLAVFNPGTGNRLYVAGQFNAIRGLAVDQIASYDGSNWFALGSGFPNASDSILDLQVYDPGTGAELYVAGTFASAGGVPASNVARWNGAAWSALGTGIDAGAGSLSVWNTGAGPRLVVGGTFWNAGGVLTGGVALFDGNAWSSINAQGRTANVVGAFDPGGGERLYTVGMIGDPNPSSTGGGTTPVTWSLFQSCFGTTWTAPTGNGLAGYSVDALESHDDGSGPQLYAGGWFHEAGGTFASNVARWNGSAWSPVGNAPSSLTQALKSFDDGTGPGLYRADLTVQKWNGATWANAGPALDQSVSLCVYDAGAGPALYAGGYFIVAGGVTLNGIARLFGSAWLPLGSGVAPLPASGTPVVWTMTAFDDGTGPALYAAGQFGFAGGIAANNIARWNGTSWSPLGSGLTGGVEQLVMALAVYDDGTGPALYAGGVFTQAGGIPCQGFAKWNGATWSAPGGGVTGTIRAMRVFDDLTGPKLYVTGNFTHAGTTPAANIARWNGASFEALGSGLQQPGLGVFQPMGFALGRHDFPSGPSLFVGGNFTLAGGRPSDMIAEIIPARPMLSMVQAGGPGSGILVLNRSLTIGLATFNVFSLEPAPGGPGTGPYLGLYASSLTPLLAQISLPLGAVPFHYTATSAQALFGPYAGLVPPGTVVEGLTLQLSGCVSAVSQIVVQ